MHVSQVPRVWLKPAFKKIASALSLLGSTQGLPWVTQAQLLGPLYALKCEADPSFILSPDVSLLLVYSKYFHRDICSLSVAI